MELEYLIFFLRSLKLKTFLEIFKQISRIWKTLFLHVIVLKMLKIVAIILSKYIFLQEIFFSHKKMTQENEIPLENPRGVLCRSYRTIWDRAEKEAGNETEQMRAHLTWIKITVFLLFKVYSVTRVWVCLTHGKLWPSQNFIHHWEPVVPLVLPDDNKVVTLCEFCLFCWLEIFL